MKKRYHILDSAKQQPVSPNDLTRMLSQNSQLMLPLVALVEQCRGAVDEVIDVTGRAAIQAVLELSAQQVTGGELSQPGKKRASDVVRWGRQPGRVRLSNRKLRVSKPRLRKRSGGEVKVPAYEAMQDDERLGARMLDILMKGVSTRNYAGVIGAMAGTAGVSKSAVSREAVEAAEKSIDEVLTRRLDELDLLVIYVDGLIFSDHVVLAAVGVDRQGNKHVLGLQHAATESTAAAEDLLTGIVERGVSTEEKQALRARWIEGLAGGGAAGLRQSSGAALPRSQAAQCRRTAAEGRARSGQSGAPSRLAAGSSRRTSAAGEARPVVRG